MTIMYSAAIWLRVPCGLIADGIAFVRSREAGQPLGAGCSCVNSLLSLQWPSLLKIPARDFLWPDTPAFRPGCPKTQKRFWHARKARLFFAFAILENHESDFRGRKPRMVFLFKNPSIRAGSVIPRPSGRGWFRATGFCYLSSLLEWHVGRPVFLPGGLFIPFYASVMFTMLPAA